MKAVITLDISPDKTKTDFSVEITPDGKKKPESMKVHIEMSPGFEDVFPIEQVGRELVSMAYERINRGSEIL